MQRFNMQYLRSMNSTWRNDKRWQHFARLPPSPEAPQSFVHRSGSQNILVDAKMSTMLRCFSKTLWNVLILGQTRNRLMKVSTKKSKVHQETKSFSWATRWKWEPFLYSTIAGKLRPEGSIVLLVASSKIASLLLPGGCTAHFRFKLALGLLAESICNIALSPELAELL